MEQNQTAPTQPVNPVVEALEKTEPVQSTSTPMQAAPAPKKKSSATVLSIILLLILALGGIGFGVWAMMDKNNQVDKLNKQIQDLRNSTSNVTPDETEEPTTQDSFSNPVLSDINGLAYSTNYETVIGGNNVNGFRYLGIGTKNGDITSCSNNGVSCTINGLSGKIYKVVDFGEGQDIAGFYTGFIMEDGTVKYFSLDDVDGKTSIDIAGSLKIDKKVVDIIELGVSQDMSSYVSSVFVFSDGTYLKFDSSMLQ